ncbi:MAG: hypothetical protein QNL91_16540, partial [Candidatus Krumholzibacteria bacterium]|nr:hypothetical protein [Candidatus Krumholzibacteria bacterium]
IDTNSEEHDNVAPEVRQMDCVDCHNRATHIYQDPEAAVNEALADGRINRALPFAKKVALGALLGNYGTDKDAALQSIDDGVRGHYMRGDDNVTGLLPDIDIMVSAVQEIYRQNIFPIMNVGWNAYPSHLGHQGQAGCFRCHNADMVDEGGKAIPYDCTLCHSILAMDSESQFQYLLPLSKEDPDRKMHQYLRDEFLGQPGPGLPDDQPNDQTGEAVPDQ